LLTPAAQEQKTTALLSNTPNPYTPMPNPYTPQLKINPTYQTPNPKPPPTSAHALDPEAPSPFRDLGQIAPGAAQFAVDAGCYRWGLNFRLQGLGLTGFRGLRLCILFNQTRATTQRMQRLKNTTCSKTPTLNCNIRTHPPTSTPTPPGPQLPPTRRHHPTFCWCGRPARAHCICARSQVRLMYLCVYLSFGLCIWGWLVGVELVQFDGFGWVESSLVGMLYRVGFNPICRAYGVGWLGLAGWGWLVGVGWVPFDAINVELGWLRLGLGLGC